MPRELYIACIDCKEFVETFKMGAYIDNKSKINNKDGIPLSADVLLSGIENIRECNKRYDAHWIAELINSLAAFYDKHSSHRLVMYDASYCDYLWYPEEDGYLEWKDITPACSAGELYLPRNLIDDLGIRSWEDALKHLKAMTIVLYEDIEIKQYKAKFDELLKAKLNML